jgi:hypothetical protein
MSTVSSVEPPAVAANPVGRGPYRTDPGRSTATRGPALAPVEVVHSPPRKQNWSPHFWEGADAAAWWRLLVRNRAAVEPKLWYVAAAVSLISTLNTALRWAQYGRHGRRIARTPLAKEPVFVVGHWRTGTTLLHELLVLDDQFTCPDTAACFEPNHHVISAEFMRTYCNWALPSKRPMDNVAAGWDKPQEDEFALVLLGQPSPYTDMAFPNRPPTFPGSLDLSGLTPPQLARWKQALYRFLQSVTYRDLRERQSDAPRRLVLKSPPHTARIPVLLDLFPDARFVHIVRDPYVVFPSTLNLWKSMGKKHAFQTPRDDARLREKVFADFRVIYDRLDESRPLVPKGRFHQLRYEDLTADPVGELEKVYRGLELDGFDRARPKLEEHTRRSKGYETNKYQLSDADRAEVTRRWGDVIRRYGYG